MFIWTLKPSCLWNMPWGLEAEREEGPPIQSCWQLWNQELIKRPVESGPELWGPEESQPDWAQWAGPGVGIRSHIAGLHLSGWGWELRSQLQGARGQTSKWPSGSEPACCPRACLGVVPQKEASFRRSDPVVASQDFLLKHHAAWCHTHHTFYLKLYPLRTLPALNFFSGSVSTSSLSSSLRASLVTVGKESSCHAGDTGHPGLIPGSGRSPGEGNGSPLQYSCLENPLAEDRGGWQATTHGVTRVGHDSATKPPPLLSLHLPIVCKITRLVSRRTGTQSPNAQWLYLFWICHSRDNRQLRNENRLLFQNPSGTYCGAGSMPGWGRGCNSKALKELWMRRWLDGGHFIPETRLPTLSDLESLLDQLEGVTPRSWHVRGYPVIVLACICTRSWTFLQLLHAVSAKTISLTITPQACMVSELFNATFQEAVNNGMGCK